MAEAEDVITDAARHVTVFARDLWRRHRPAGALPREPTLSDFAPRIDLLIAAVLGVSYPIRPAQTPARPTLLERVFDRDKCLRASGALPATDGTTLWLPPELGIPDEGAAAERYRVLGLRQALRAHRGSARPMAEQGDTLRQDLYLVLDAHATDEALLTMLPGMRRMLIALRSEALAQRPALSGLPVRRQAFEAWVQGVLRLAPGERHISMRSSATPAHCWAVAGVIADAQRAATRPGAALGPLLKDMWTGELRPPPGGDGGAEVPHADQDDAAGASPPRSARMERRPQVRKATQDEDDQKPGAWMIQTEQPHEKAEDSFGMQRPADRDDTTGADEFADALSELPEARLVLRAGRAKEILISDDPPEARKHAPLQLTDEGSQLAYPEWDYRSGCYRFPGAIVQVARCALGEQSWVDKTTASQACVLENIRRRFEMLRAQRMKLRRQLDGDEIDLAACVEAYADFRAGLPLNQALYEQRRNARRDVAATLLIDVSGSTDAWIAADKRVIDVEREALLLVCLALEGLGEPYSVTSFSGEGPKGVVVRHLKGFDERYGKEIGQRIAALEPEHFTRAGAAIRHATAGLMKQPARHRLLLLLSDGKPNDVDQYDGRYGVEDMRQAITEAKLQGVFPFCLTIDRHAASYLPQVFGIHQYALLTRPERLPIVLLDWMKRLLAGA